MCPTRTVLLWAACSSLLGILCAKAAPLSQFVIVGATGDLSKKYLIKAFAHLQSSIGASVELQLHGAARASTGAGAAALDAAIAAVPCALLAGSDTQQGGCRAFTDALRATTTYTSVKQVESGFQALCSTLDGAAAPAERLESRIFFLAIPPSAYATTVAAIQASCHTATAPWHARFVVEKPFGLDHASGSELLAAVQGRLQGEREALLLVDHYLTKSTTGLLPLLRRGGPADWVRDALQVHAPAPLWRLQRAEAVMLEADDVAGRTGFYDGVGVVRDVLQNHATELLLSAVTHLAPLSHVAGVGADGGDAEVEKAGAAPIGAAAAADRADFLRRLACLLGYSRKQSMCGASYDTACDAEGTTVHVGWRPYGQEGAPPSPGAHTAAAWHAAVPPAPCNASGTAQGLLARACAAGGAATSERCPHIAVAAGQYSGYAAHVAADTGRPPRAGTATAAQVAVTVPAAHAGAPPLTLIATAGKAAEYRSTFVRALYEARVAADGPSSATASITVVLAGTAQAVGDDGAEMAVQGPAIVLSGAALELKLPLQGWRRVSPGSSDGARLQVWVPAAASRHGVPTQARAPGASAAEVADAYLAAHAGDVAAAASDALGGVQAYSTLFAAALAGAEDWFVSPAEVLALWQLWDPIVRAVEQAGAAAA